MADGSKYWTKLIEVRQKMRKQGKKICAKVPDDDALINLHLAITVAGLPNYMIKENEKMSVLGIGPAPVEMVDEVTSHLKLL